MKKRFLGLVLMLAMMLALLPSTAEAATSLDFGEEWWPVTQDDLDNGELSALELNNGYLADGKKYFLAENITLYHKNIGK